MQCLHRYYYDRTNINQLYNAGKYLSSISAGLVAYIYLVSLLDVTSEKFNTWYVIYIILQTISTIYCYGWDIYMDWGLLRSKEPDKYGLRSIINYNQPFYYYAIASDFLLRCTWVLSVVLYLQDVQFISSIGYGTCMGLLELFRRW